MTSRHSGEWIISLLGASTLRGKEVKAVLEERHLPLRRLQLVDTEAVQGQLTEFEDEPAILQPVTSETFQETDLAIFAADPSFTSQHWRQAQESGCRIIDMSYFLDSESQACRRAPLIEPLWEAEANDNGLREVPGGIVVSAHPMSIALAGILKSLSRRTKVVRAAATLFEPASEHGQVGVEELHQQTIGLLSFQEIPKKVFDAQLSFNLLTRNGEQSQPTLQQGQERISNHLAGLLRGSAAPPALRLLQAPVFHGYAFSWWMELAEPLEPAEMETVLDREPFSVCRMPGDQPNVVSAVSSDKILLGAIKRDSANDAGYWIWGAFDNLRIAALNAVRIAEEMMELPSSSASAQSRQAETAPWLRP